MSLHFYRPKECKRIHVDLGFSSSRQMMIAELAHRYKVAQPRIRDTKLPRVSFLASTIRKVNGHVVHDEQAFQTCLWAQLWHVAATATESTCP